jgi:two-component system, OmpR family, sensor kinase
VSDTRWRTSDGATVTDRGVVTASLIWRAALAGCLVALVSVMATAVVAVPLANQAARNQAAEALAAEADLLAAALGSEVLPAAGRRVRSQLARQGIELWIVTAGQAERPGLPARVVAPLAAGQEVSLRGARVNGRISLVEGRPLPSGDAVVLTRPFATGIGSAVISRLWLPLLAGLGVGALIGTLLAAGLARPLRRAANAAARLRTGDRRVRVPVEAPAEVAELAHAINDLATALAAGETRQREFLLSVSHELRTPLTTIKGYAEAVADDLVDGSSLPGIGRVMLTETHHLERLISDLLALARLEADDFVMRPISVDLTALVREITTAWEPQFTAAGLRWRHECSVTDDPVVVTVDPDRLRQVVDGLLGNALRLVPAGAPVVLALAQEPAAVLIEVRDGGPGLTDDDLAVAFVRGGLSARYRDNRKVGSGLGLALAARLITRLGGSINAGHAPEGGARFTVTLPTSGTSALRPSRPYETRTRT